MNVNVQDSPQLALERKYLYFSKINANPIRKYHAKFIFCLKIFKDARSSNFIEHLKNKQENNLNGFTNDEKANLDIYS